jgi:hypothetical protein
MGMHDSFIGSCRLVRVGKANLSILTKPNWLIRERKEKPCPQGYEVIPSINQRHVSPLFLAWKRKAVTCKGSKLPLNLQVSSFVSNSFLDFDNRFY